MGSAVVGAKASKAKRKSAKFERRASEVANFRQVREVIRASRLATAANVSNAAASGAEIGSSGVQGNLQSVRSRTASSLIINNRIASLQGSAFDQSLRAAKFSTFSGVLGTFAQLGFAAAGTFGGGTPSTGGIPGLGQPGKLPGSGGGGPVGPPSGG